MSEYYEGKLICVDAGDETEFDLDTSDGGTIASCFRGNARRIAAAWNACEGMPTDDIEELAACQGVMTLTVYADDMLAELNAAHALLREVINMHAGEIAFQLEKRIGTHLDACDTLEGK